MQRKLTDDERQILLKNPELVMFIPRGKGCLLLFLSVEVIFLIALIIELIFRDTIPFAVVVVTLIGYFAPVPVAVLLALMRAPDWLKPNKRQQKTHYLRELKKSLPKGSMINIVTIRYFIAHDGVIFFTVDGKEESCGATGFVNTFDLAPGTEVITVLGKDSRAFVKRAPQTEKLYESFLKK